MTPERTREMLKAVIGFIADQYEVDGLYTVAKRLKITEEELAELGWKYEKEGEN